VNRIEKRLPKGGRFYLSDLDLDRGSAFIDVSKGGRFYLSDLDLDRGSAFIDVRRSEFNERS
jgi:hypothetical protein